MNKTRWQQLSPLLDELLDLEPEKRLQRLAAWRAEDKTIAEDLGALLGHLTTNERDGFLERPLNLDDTGGMAGRRIGAYSVERELGQGGMGSVWLARRTDGRYDGMVAVKFLNMALASGGGAARFAREGSILARLAHPNIARLVDAGVTSAEGQPYLVLEYIAGQTIDRYCEAHELDVDARVRLFLDVLAAVEHAHNRLILHRDVKPSNILVTDAGEVKLLDFGIAKLLDDAGAGGQATELTRQAGGAFTPRFAAPEQVRGEEVTTATDVYALGVLLYVLLGRLHPTSNTPSTPVDQMRAVVEYEPKRLSEAVIKDRPDDAESARLAKQLRGDLDNIVAKALKKSPAERYANAAQFADDLRRYLADEPVTARRDAFVYRTVKFIRRHRLGVAAGSTVAVALSVGIGVALWQAREARQQRGQAEGLIEFMLGDLRKKLQPVGRLDVLDAVGAKTLAYYASQDSDRLDAESLSHRARALHLIGEIHDKRGRLDEALAAFQGAADTTSQLLARTPNEGQRIFDHAQSVYWVGYVAWRRGQASQAETLFLDYLRLAQRLVALDPGNVEWRLETVYAGQNLGVVYLDSPRPTQALSAFEAVRDSLLGMVKLRPELYFDLANAHGWIAKAHQALSRFDEALAAQHAKIAALNQVPNAEKNREVQRLLANGNHEESRIHLEMGRPAVARDVERAALKRYESLVVLDPTNVVWIEGMCMARLGLVETELALDARHSAHEGIERAAADIEGLKIPASPQTNRHILLKAALFELQARMALMENRPLSTAPLVEFINGVSSFVAQGKPLDRELRRRIASVELLLGDLLAKDEQRQAAQARWLAAAQRVRQDAANGSMQALTLLSRAEIRTGEMSEPRSQAERIKSSSYRHPDVAVLVSELALASGPGHSLNSRK